MKPFFVMPHKYTAALAIACVSFLNASAALVYTDQFDGADHVAGIPEGWTLGKHFGKTSPKASFTVAPAPDGEAGGVLSMTSADGSVPVIALSPLLDVEADAEYTLCARLRSDRDGVPVRMFVIPNNFSNFARIDVSASNEWQEATLTFHATKSSPRPVNLRFDLMSEGTLLIDNVEFAKTRNGSGQYSRAKDFMPASGIIDGGMEKTECGKIPSQWKLDKHYGQMPENSVFAVDGKVCRSGRQSLKAVHPGIDKIPAIIMSNPAATTPGETYVITAWMKSAGAPVEIRLMAMRSDFKGAERLSAVVTGEWRRYRLVFTAAPGSEAYTARFDIYPGTVWIDDVSICRKSDITETDGPATGVRYAGNAGEKTVEITLGGPTGRRLKNINGVCYARGFGLREFPPVWTNVNLRVVRLHNALSHLNILPPDSADSRECDFSVFDEAVGQILRTGAVPQICLCFVPVAFVADPEPGKIREKKYYLGLPDSFDSWEKYVYQVVKHCSETYENFADWFWIVGNEPGVKQFSVGSKDDFYSFYRHTAEAAVRADPSIRIGAGSFAHFDWLDYVVRRCAAENTRLDIISWHHYNVVPRDYVWFVNRVRSLADECGMDKVILAIDEWNAILPDFRPRELSAGNYAAAHAAASIDAMRDAGLDYQTHFIASSPHGFGMTGRKGIRQPTFNLYEMFAETGENEIKAKFPEDDPYIGGFASSAEDGKITLMVWYAKSQHDISEDFNKAIKVKLPEISPDSSCIRYVIDSRHSNSITDPSREKLECVPQNLLSCANGGSETVWDAEPNSISLLVISPANVKTE